MFSVTNIWLNVTHAQSLAMLHKSVPLFKNIIFVLNIRIDKLERIVMNKIRQLLQKLSDPGCHYWP